MIYKTEKVYISGPMSALPREEYIRNFAEAEQKLRDMGYRRIVNPTHIFVCKYEWIYHMLARLLGANTTYTLVLLYDLWLLTHCNLIYKIPGWQESRGANIESCAAYWFHIWPVPTKKRMQRKNEMIKELQNRWRNT